jgi:hypothetical protein
MRTGSLVFSCSPVRTLDFLLLLVDSVGVGSDPRGSGSARAVGDVDAQLAEADVDLVELLRSAHDFVGAFVDLVVEQVAFSCRVDQL